MSKHVSSRIAGFRHAMRASAAAVAIMAGTGAQAAIHQFAGSPDGANPRGKLLNVTCSGTTYAYGTTQNGGLQGTVFNQVLPSGAYNIIYNFTGIGTDGAQPVSGLIRVGAYLYGTTSAGGSNHLGTVYRIPIGSCGPAAATTVWSFHGAPEGGNPAAALYYHGGKLYGTASTGGNAGNGTVFECGLIGPCKAIYTFLGGTDGAEPLGSVIFYSTLVSGTLESAFFGTTAVGGAGQGTIYAVPVPLTGHDQVLWRFTGGSDGANPLAELLQHQAHFISTAWQGASANCTGGCGTVFSFNPANLTMTWIHDFIGNASTPPDGAYPAAGVVYNSSTNYLLGTTSQGGSSTACGPTGCGTVFYIRPTGLSEGVGFNFINTPSGAHPAATLDLFGSTAYGTAFDGGTFNDGTLF